MTSGDGGEEGESMQNNNGTSLSYQDLREMAHRWPVLDHKGVWLRGRAANKHCAQAGEEVTPSILNGQLGGHLSGSVG